MAKQKRHTFPLLWLVLRAVTAILVCTFVGVQLLTVASDQRGRAGLPSLQPILSSAYRGNGGLVPWSILKARRKRELLTHSAALTPNTAPGVLQSAFLYR